MITLKLKRRDCFAISLSGKKNWIELIYSEVDTRKMSWRGQHKKTGDFKPIAYGWMVDNFRIWSCKNLTHLAIVMDYILRSDYGIEGRTWPHLSSTDTGHKGAVLGYAVDYIVDFPQAVWEALNGQVDNEIRDELAQSARRFQIEIPERR
jgi:hypothetical protein